MKTSQERQPAARSEGELGLVFPCRHCGAPVELREHQASAACEHCGSALFVVREAELQVCLAEDRLAGAEALREAWIERRLAEYRATLHDELRDEQGRPALGPEIPPPFLKARLAARRRRLDGRVKVLRSRLVQAPYWHEQGLIVQGLVGRPPGGGKKALVRAYTLEHTAPAYDAGRFNLRDRGLRLRLSGLRLLGRSEAEGLCALPALPPPESLEQETRRWLSRPLVPRFHAIARHARHVGARRVLVYKPLWLAEIADEDGARWVLVDGQTGTLAGRLESWEAPDLWDCADEPLEARSETRVILLASRCPECGRDLPPDKRAFQRVCSGCHAGLALSAAGLVRKSYDHAELVGAPRRPSWLPFWSFRFRLRLKDGNELASWPEVFAELGLPPGLRLQLPAGDRLLVPALRLLGDRGGDASFQELVAWVHRAPIVPREGPLPPVPTGEVLSVTLPREEAEELGTLLVLAVLDPPAAARLNVPIVHRLVRDAELELSSGKLLLLPFAAEPEGFRAPRDRAFLPLLHARGGAALEAQRRSVVNPD